MTRNVFSQVMVTVACLALTNKAEMLPHGLGTTANEDIDSRLIL